jgi:hypothetical protein
MGCQLTHIHDVDLDAIYKRQEQYRQAIYECDVQKKTVDAQIQAIFNSTKEDMCP